jgi:serine protease Do
MIRDTRVKPKSGWLKSKKFIVFGLVFFLAGLVAASSLQITGTSVAAEFKTGTSVKTGTPPAMPSSFAELANKLSPTVVNVKVTKFVKTGFSGQNLPEGDMRRFFEHFFGRMPEMRQMPRERRTQGLGSGVIISNDGYILTNDHVVAGAKEVTVTFSNQEEYKAEVVGRDPKTDLAVLKIEGKEPFPSAALGDSEKLKVGDWVVAIGNPFGLNHTVTSGIVSAKGRVIGAGPYDDFIQTDASINPGNSGGPLFNMHGQVVGINTAIIPQGQGIGFAIPVNTAKPLIPQLVNDGEVTRGYLGVNIQSISPDLAKAMKLDERKGALVSGVMNGSAADKGGIKRGDIITSFNGKPVKGAHDLPAMVAATPVDKEVQVEILRKGKPQEITVKLGKLPNQHAGLNNQAKPATGQWGLQLNEMNEQVGRRYGLEAEQGVVVVGVEPGSPAQKAGIKKGDVIVEVNQKTVASVKDVTETIKESKDKENLLLLVQRDKNMLYVPLQQKG